MSLLPLSLSHLEHFFFPVAAAMSSIQISKYIYTHKYIHDANTHIVWKEEKDKGQPRTDKNVGNKKKRKQKTRTIPIFAVTFITMVNDFAFVRLCISMVFLPLLYSFSSSCFFVLLCFAFPFDIIVGTCSRNI